MILVVIVQSLASNDDDNKNVDFHENRLCERRLIDIDKQIQKEAKPQQK